MSAKQAPDTILGRPIGPVGYGMMTLSFYSNTKEEYLNAEKVLKAALDSGANFWNAGLFYGAPDNNSLHLLKWYFERNPGDAEKVVLNVKGAFEFATQTPQGSPEGIRASVDEAIRILGGTKKIDIFECARVDPKVPIETSVKALAELVEEGKIGGIGLSEVSASTIRRAAAVAPVAAVEIELSLFTTDVLTSGVADACHELGIPMVAYSPVGRGFLSNEFRSLDDLPAGDIRRRWARFQPDVFDQNLKLADAVRGIAERKGVATAQVAIAWVIKQGAIPIPGSTKIGRVVEGCKDVVDLTDDDMRELQGILDTIPVAGARYGGEQEELLNM